MRYLISICILFFVSLATAQYTQQYNQYMFNGLAINPAYAGVRECLSITGIHSNQWVGFDGAPSTENLTAHTPFRKNVGLGLNVFNDRIATQNQTGASVSYAYHLKLNTKSKLSFGVSAGVSVFQVRDNGVITVEQNDKAFANQFQTYSFPRIGTGLFYYRERFYAGLSVPTLFSSEYSKVADSRFFNLNSNAMVIMQTSGAVIGLTDEIQWKPSYLVKFIPSISSDVDLNSNFYFKEKFNLGLSYRVKKSLIGMVGCTIKNNFDIGYSYGFPLSSLANYNSGTHEVMLRYEFRKVVSTINPRLY